jgi:hypothetical protein
MMGDVNSGSASDLGIIPRSVAEIFSMIEADADSKYQLSFNCLEIYNNKLLDLLRDTKNTKPASLDVKRDSKDRVYFPGCSEHKVTTPEGVIVLLTQAQKLRATSSTKMNAGSSRSHMIVTLHIVGLHAATGVTTMGKLTLVDLAGSEKASKTGASGSQLEEAKAINTSLSALGDVISALSKGEKHVPYRNNMLTRALQDSIGGNAKTLCFVNASPADYNLGETNNSLTYAARMKLITNNATKTADSKETAALRARVNQLKTFIGDESMCAPDTPRQN